MTTYFPVTRQGEFESLDAMCSKTGIEADLARSYLNDAERGSQLVVCNRISLGKPELGFRAVLQPAADGSLVLWLGLVYSSTQKVREVQEFARDAAARYGREFSVGASSGLITSLEARTGG